MTALGAGIASLVLAGPAFLAVSDVSRSRPLAPLADFAAVLIVGAGILAAFAVTAEIAAIADLLHFPVSFVLAGPPVVGTAPWAAGELCAGPSPRQDHAWAAALIAAYLLALATEFGNAALIVRSLSSACAASLAYLCARGNAP